MTSIIKIQTMYSIIMNFILLGAARYNMPKSKAIKILRKTTTLNVKRQPRTRKTKRKSKRIRTVNVPAAQGVRIPKASFRRVYSHNNEQEIILEGEDLIIPTPDALPVTSQPFPIFLSIPANPLYWKGTRVSGIAAVYQQYRPLRFEVEYVPQVPVTCPGQVIYGTLYNKGVSKESFQQTLMTSNGGGMTQCYLKSHSHVICNKKTLPLTLYNTFDSMNENVANPFTWCAHYSGQWSGQGQATTSQPGWVWVRWKYLFSVGLGSQSGEVIVYNQTDAELSARNNFFAGWGVALSFLKEVGTKLLTKIAIVLLEETDVQVKAGLKHLNSKLGIGSTFSVEPASINESLSSNAGTITVRDDAGNTYDIPEGVRVVIYQNGDTYEVQDETPLEGTRYIYFNLYWYNVDENLCSQIEPSKIEGPEFRNNVASWKITITGDVIYLKFITTHDLDWSKITKVIIQASSTTEDYFVVMGDQFKNATMWHYAPLALGVGHEHFLVAMNYNSDDLKYSIEDMISEGIYGGRKDYFKETFTPTDNSSPMKI